MSLLIICFLLMSTCFAPFLIYCLRISIKSKELPLRINCEQALKKIFIALREEKDLDSIASILDLKTFDTLSAYIESCASINSIEYRYIIEYCFMNEDMKLLAKLLPGNCVMAMSETIFLDNWIAMSLRNLPISPLSCIAGSFRMRVNVLADVYREIVFKTVRSKAINIDWNNLVKVSPDSVQVLSLSDSFDKHMNFKTKKKLFYYLKPTLLHFVSDLDILWLTEAVLPAIPMHSTDVYLSNFLEPKIFSFWTDQIFRTVSTLSFYLELDLSNINLKSSGIKHNPLIVLKAQRIALERLNGLNSVVKRILGLKLRCFPFQRIINILNDLHNMFLGENFLKRKKSFSNLYLKISECFKNYAHKSIQGDWMLNLFTLFWEGKEKKSLLDCDYFPSNEIENSILIFFSRRPTIEAINTVYIMFEANFGIKINSKIIGSFESLIPDNRILDVYKLHASALPRKFSSISFNIRYKLAISDARKIVSQYNRNNQKKAKSLIKFFFVSSPISNPRSISYQSQILDALKLTISAIHRSTIVIEPIYTSTPFTLIERNFSRPVDLRTCLEQFFELILNVPQFRILIDEKRIGTSCNSNFNRPIVVITPLITKSLANLLGQAFALSIILEIKIPFIILKEQMISMYSKNEFSSSNQLNLMIRRFCDTQKHLKLLDYQIDPLNFVDSFSKYLKYFNSRSSLFLETKLKSLESRNNFIDKAFRDCNYQIFSGIKFYFYNSKFTIDEMHTMIFKTK